MQMFHQFFLGSQPWLDDLFSANAVAQGGIVRQAVSDVEREVGRAALIAEVRCRGYHLIECDGQFIIICNPGQLKLIC
jgi:hypothetical protein